MLARRSLRVRLLALLVLLSGAGLALAGFAAVALLDDYLVGRVDQQLEQFGPPPFSQATNPPTGTPQPGITGMREPVQRPSLPTDFALYVYDADGVPIRTVASEAVEADPPQLPTLDETSAAALAEEPFTVNSADGTPYRVLVRTDPVQQTTTASVVSLAGVETTVHQLGWITAGVSVVVLALLAAIGAYVVRLGLRPLTDIEAATRRIAAGDLATRVPEGPERTEVGRLARSFNTMLARIEDAFRRRERSEEAVRRFVADAGHELRTPLTSVRGFAELYRRGGLDDPDELARAMRRIEAEAQRMGALVDDMLVLARLDQHPTLAVQTVDLLVVAADSVHDAAVRAPGRQVRLTGLAGDAPDSGGVLVLGDDARLRQVLGNLLSNAVVHGAGTITVRVGRAGGAAVVEVADEGSGLTEPEAARVFERFYRVDASRRRDQGGSGLGLSIVQAVVGAHGGGIQVVAPPGEGAVFRLELPALERLPVKAGI